MRFIVFSVLLPCNPQRLRPFFFTCKCSWKRIGNAWDISATYPRTNSQQIGTLMKQFSIVFLWKLPVFPPLLLRLVHGNNQLDVLLRSRLLTISTWPTLFENRSLYSYACEIDVFRIKELFVQIWLSLTNLKTQFITKKLWIVKLTI